MNRTMSFVAILPALLLATAASAGDGTPVISGEFDNTGHTLRKGTSQMYLGTRYARGISEDFQIGTSFLGWIGGANLTAEYAIMQDDESAFSIDTNLRYGWNGGYDVALVPTYTMGGQQTSRFNAGLGVGQTKFDEATDAVLQVPLTLSYDLVPNQQTTFRFHFRSDIMSAVGDDSDLVFTGGANWNHGWKKYRLALGVNLTNFGLGDLEDTLELLGVEPSLPSVYPLPYIRMWWRW